MVKDGKIHYLKIISNVFIVALVYAIISKLFISTAHSIDQSVVAIYTLYVLLIIELLILTSKSYIEFIKFLGTFILKFMSLPKLQLPVNEEEPSFKTYKVNQSYVRLNLLNSVIRC